MSIKKASKIGGIVCIVCLLILSACAVHVITSISAMEEFAQKRFDSILLAQEVRATSSALTANARAYVSTANSEYENTYWDLVRIRSGEIPRPLEAAVAPGETVPMNTLLEKAGFTAEELGLLAESVKISGELVLLEDKAMNAAKGLYQDTTGKYTVKGDPDLEMARQLMFSKEYDATVDRIMVPSFKFDRLVNARINAQYGDVLSTLNYAIIALCVSVAVMAVLLILGIYMLLRRIMAPVSASADFAHTVAEGNLDAAPPAFKFSGSNEIGQMITSLQRMVANLKERITQAEEKSQEAAQQGQKAAAALSEAMAAKQEAEVGHKAIISAATNVEQVVNHLSAATEDLSAHVEESTRSTETQRERVSASAISMEQMNTAV
ncbi:MAG: HAMP domain-containing protein, partial [Deltaproteobacteria bacterium]|nr:HAMP domain-containing protein [Deltaproteobacteria bacterium]